MEPNKSWNKLSDKIKEDFDVEWSKLFESINDDGFRHESWEPFLTENEELLKDVLKKLSVSDEFYPSECSEIFRFMKRPVEQIKYVIIGQDPYPTDHEKDGEIVPDATGRSFEVRDAKWNDIGLNRSLQNILKALYYNEKNKVANIALIRNEIKDESIGFLKNNSVKSWFDDAEERGVLWLNVALTVQAGERVRDVAGSHLDIWEEFMSCVFLFLHNSRIKLIPLGSNAQKCMKKIEGQVLSGGLYYHPSYSKFVTNNCFEKMHIPK